MNVGENPNLARDRRRALRKAQTPHEALLWSKLRAAQLGVRFPRQHSVGPYIIDFFCANRKLAVELDGSQHIDQCEYDEQRTAYLNEKGIRVLRFGNNETNANLEGVLLRIQKILDER